MKLQQQTTSSQISWLCDIFLGLVILRNKNDINGAGSLACKKKTFKIYNWLKIKYAGAYLKHSWERTGDLFIGKTVMFAREYLGLFFVC